MTDTPHDFPTLRDAACHDQGDGVGGECKDLTAPQMGTALAAILRQQARMSLVDLWALLYQYREAED